MKKTSKFDRLTAIVLAAGKGTRMQTSLPKVLHPVAGQPMIMRTLLALKSIGVDEIRVIV
ncbi:MAG: NTP transferase domain-containing protein, partial [Bdellovibrionales bacterium]|nr:NTP transferase domain-containing protein [Bdellovibrionales bacterium]